MNNLGENKETLKERDTLKDNNQFEEDLMKEWDDNPTLRNLAQAAFEEFDENGNYVGK